MRNKMKNDEGKLLFAVNYVERPSLKDVHFVHTHSKKRAIECAKHLLKCREDLLYAQVVVYRYSSIMDYYQFVTLRNFYGFSSFETNDRKMDDLLFDLILED